MNPQKSTLYLDSRSVLTLTAVDSVISFDESEVSLSLGETVLTVSGNDLNITKLSLESGEVSVTGRIDAMVYFDSAPRKKRLFGK